MKKVVLKLSGMHCSSCSLLIDTLLEELPGVKSAETNYVKQQVKVCFDPTKTNLNRIIAIITTEGYQVLT